MNYFVMVVNSTLTALNRIVYVTHGTSKKLEALNAFIASFLLFLIVSVSNDLSLLRIMQYAVCFILQAR
jgi:hypothetical protein